MGQLYDDVAVKSAVTADYGHRHAATTFTAPESGRPIYRLCAICLPGLDRLSRRWPGSFRAYSDHGRPRTATFLIWEGCPVPWQVVQTAAGQVRAFPWQVRSGVGIRPPPPHASH
jgi:hypothetical protein